MKRSDLISGVLVVVTGLLMIYVVVPAQISSSGGYGLDPAFFPVSLLWLLVGLGALLVLTRLFALAGQDDTGGGLDAKDWGFIVAATGVSALAVLAIGWLGFVIAGTVLMAVVMLAIERRQIRWVEIAIFPAFTAFAIYWLLYNAFSVQLPPGPF